MYTNEASLKDSQKAANLDTLLRGADGENSQARLERAAKAAAAMIDSKLKAGGFVLPLEFTPYGEDIPTDGPEHLNALLQSASDAFTMYYLAIGRNLNTAEFKEAYDHWIGWLDRVKMRKEELDIPRTDDPTGRGDAVVLARESILDSNLAYPGCCGRTLYRNVP